MVAIAIGLGILVNVDILVKGCLTLTVGCGGEVLMAYELPDVEFRPKPKPRAKAKKKAAPRIAVKPGKVRQAVVPGVPSGTGHLLIKRNGADMLGWDVPAKLTIDQFKALPRMLKGWKSGTYRMIFDFKLKAAPAKTGAGGRS